jgi:arylsulfatase A-like enzyme
MKFRLQFALWSGICTLTYLFIAPAGAQSSYLEGLRLKSQGCPDIIFILADDLGYGDLSCYGQKKIKTPNIDRLASEGMRFTQAYAGSTVCAPSRAALMTGLHMGHARIRGNAKVPLEPGDVTVAKVLKAAGYSTGAIGKWGLGDEGTTGHPNRQGFDEWFGYLDQTHAHNYYPEYLWRNGQKWPVRGNANGQKNEYSHDRFTSSALNFLRINQQRPFFLYLAYTLPHANNELGNKTGNGMEVPDDQPYSNEKWPQAEKNKAAMITRLDTDVGRILDKLKELKLDQNTIVLFSSDNGPHKEGGVDPNFFESSGPLRGTKRDLYEGGIRVPLIVRWPPRIKAGSNSNAIFTFWDFLPSAAELGRTTPPKEIDGISLVPTLLGLKQTNQHEFLYWEFHEGGTKQAVRMGDWKAVRLAPDKPLELYNLKNDIAEKENIADGHPEVVEKIEKYLKTARSENEHWPIKAPKEEKPDKTEEKPAKKPAA